MVISFSLYKNSQFPSEEKLLRSSFHDYTHGGIMDYTGNHNNSVILCTVSDTTNKLIINKNGRKYLSSQ